MQTNTMSLPDTHSFDRIVEKAKERTKAEPLTAAIVAPSSAPSLSGFADAVNDGFIKPVLIGSQSDIDEYLKATQLSADDSSRLTAEQPFEAVRMAAQLINDGTADFIVRGNVCSSEMLSSLSSNEVGFVGKKAVLSHVAILKADKYPKLLFVSDGVVNEQPDTMTKVAIINNAATVCRKLGVDTPRTAVLAAVEVVYPQMNATTDGAILTQMNNRRQIKGVFVDGPLSFDIAIDSEAAAAKGITDSTVAGQTDLMIAPNSFTANGIYKAMTAFGEAQSAGVLVGGRTPVAFAARHDNPSALYNSIAVCCLLV